MSRGGLGRWAHLPLVGRHIQNAFFRQVEEAAVLALAFCHAHEITLKDLATYGVLQVTARHICCLKRVGPVPCCPTLVCCPLHSLTCLFASPSDFITKSGQELSCPPAFRTT